MAESVPAFESTNILVGWYILFYFARMNRHFYLLAWTSGLSRLSQKDEERKEILHESEACNLIREIP